MTQWIIFIIACALFIMIIAANYLHQLRLDDYHGQDEEVNDVQG